MSKMGPTSRPPLSSRIRASFDGKRSKSSNDNNLDPLGSNPPNGFFAQDVDSIRNVIDAAINSETFQTAIAANLAKLIKPNIKSALDTIQPLVESVYAHEMLLRKTNRSVEDILDRVGDGGGMSRRASRVDSEIEFPSKRASRVEVEDTAEEATPTAEGFKELGTMDTPKNISHDESPKHIIHDKSIVATSPAHNLEEFKQLLDENNAKTAATLSELTSSVNSSNTAIISIAQGFDDVNDLLHPTKESLDKLTSSSEQSATVMAVVQGQLDQLKDDIGHIMTELSALKGSLSSGAPSNSEGFSKLSTEISGVLAAVEGHSNTLSDIKNANPHPEIMSALQLANEHHTSHAAALSELKERSLAAPAETKLGPDHTAALEELKADLASMKENIQAGLTSNNDNLTGLGSKIDSHHEKYYEALEGIRSLNVAAAPPVSSTSTDLEAKIAGIQTSLDTHTAALDDIKASHTAHSVALENIRSVPTDDPETSQALHAKIAEIKDSLDAHTAALDEIKATYTAHTSAFESQGAVLDDIKASHASSVAALESIRSAPAGEVNTGNSDGLDAKISEVKDALNAHTTALDEIKAAHVAHSTALESQTATLGDIKNASELHSTALEGHGTTLESIRDLNSGSASAPAPAVDTSALESQISSLASTLDAHTTALDEVKASHTAHASALEAHTAALEDIKTATASHTNKLEELKSITGASADSPPLPIIDPEKLDTLQTQIGDIASTLSTHTTALDQIVASNGAHKESLDEIIGLQDGHTAALNEITEKHVAHAEALDGLKGLHESHAASLDEIKGLYNSHAAALDDIKATNATHTASFDELKGLGTSHATALESSRSVADTQPSSDPALAAQIATLSTALDGHKAHLEDFKTSLPTSTAIVPTPDSPSHLSEDLLSTIVGTLESHTTLLTELKDDVAAEILTSLHDMGQVCANHTNLLTEIREGDVSDEILTLLHSTDGKLDGVSVGVTKIGDWEVEGGLGALEEKVSDLEKKLGEHNDTLNNVKDTTAASHELQTRHDATLSEIKEKSLEPKPAAESDASGLHEKIDGIATKLDEHHAALSTLHAAHSSSLDELKSRSVETSAPAQAVDITALEEKLNAIQNTLDDHHTTLSTIKDATSTSLESHADHTTALNEIQEASLSSVDSHASHAAALAGIKEITDTLGEAHLSHIDALSEIKDGQNAHSATLNEIIAQGGTKDKESGSLDLAAIETHLTAITSILEAQDATLADIKSASSHGDIISNLDSLKALVEESKVGLDEHGALVKDLHSSTQTLHNDTKDKHESILSGIAGLAIGGAAGSALTSSDSDSKEVLEKLESIHVLASTTSGTVTTINENITSMKSQLDINHTTMTTSITTLSDELKAEIDATGTEISDHLSMMASDLQKANAVGSGVHLNDKGIEQLKSHVEDGVHLNSKGVSQLQTHVSPLSTKEDGIHLSDRGLSQLQEHLSSANPPNSDGVHLNPAGLAQLREHFTTEEPLSESTWFGNRQKTAMPTKDGSESGSVVLDPIHEEEEEDSPKEADFQHRHEESAEVPYPRDQIDVFKYLEDPTPNPGASPELHATENADGLDAEELREGYPEEPEAKGVEAAEAHEHEEFGSEYDETETVGQTEGESHTIFSNESDYPTESHVAPSMGETAEDEEDHAYLEKSQNWSIVDKDEEDPFEGSGLISASHVESEPAAHVEKGTSEGSVAHADEVEEKAAKEEEKESEAVPKPVPEEEKHEHGDEDDDAPHEHGEGVPVSGEHTTNQENHEHAESTKVGTEPQATEDGKDENEEAEKPEEAEVEAGEAHALERAGTSHEEGEEKEAEAEEEKEKEKEAEEPKEASPETKPESLPEDRTKLDDEAGLSHEAKDPESEAVDDGREGKLHGEDVKEE